MEDREPRPDGRRSKRTEACPAEEHQTDPGPVVLPLHPDHKEKGLKSSSYCRASSSASSGAALNMPSQSVQAVLGRLGKGAAWPFRWPRDAGEADG